MRDFTKYFYANSPLILDLPKEVGVRILQRKYQQGGVLGEIIVSELRPLVMNNIIKVSRSLPELSRRIGTTIYDLESYSLGTDAPLVITQFALDCIRNDPESAYKKACPETNNKKVKTFNYYLKENSIKFGGLLLQNVNGLLLFKNEVDNPCFEFDEYYQVGVQAIKALFEYCLDFFE